MYVTQSARKSYERSTITKLLEKAREILSAEFYGLFVAISTRPYCIIMKCHNTRIYQYRYIAHISHIISTV